MVQSRPHRALRNHLGWKGIWVTSGKQAFDMFGNEVKGRGGVVGGVVVVAVETWRLGPLENGFPSKR